MSEDTVIFTLTVRPGSGGKEVFHSSLDQIITHGAGGAVFNVISLSHDLAVLRGAIVRDRRTTTAEGLSEYLADTLASKAGIQLDFDLEIEAREWPRPDWSAIRLDQDRPSDECTLPGP